MQSVADVRAKQGTCGVYISVVSYSAGTWASACILSLGRGFAVPSASMPLKNQDLKTRPNFTSQNLTVQGSFLRFALRARIFCCR